MIINVHRLQFNLLLPIKYNCTISRGGLEVNRSFHMKSHSTLVDQIPALPFYEIVLELILQDGQVIIEMFVQQNFAV